MKLAEITEKRRTLSAVTNAALGERLRKAAETPRRFSATERGALLLEAADRLDEHPGETARFRRVTR